uniref:Uncharacterized protein n=1 Tax=Panagrolaimus sp. PS1159 TaxID=55785 RepID=A0AC35G886_9BILA
MKIIGIFLLICQLSVCLENEVSAEIQASTVANFVVHPEVPENGKSLKPMFDFMPHFDKSNYEFMIPEGKNNQESVAAVIQFFGLLSKPTPQFQLVGDDNAWFKIGDVETVKEPNYMISSVPILTKIGADVIYQEANKGIYTLKIEAKGDDGNTAQSNINVEVLSFGPPVIREETKKPIADESVEAKSLEPTISITEGTEQPTVVDN